MLGMSPTTVDCVVLLSMAGGFFPSVSAPSRRKGARRTGRNVVTCETDPLRITNVYFPPESSAVLQRLDRNADVDLRLSDNEILTGNLNAHDPLWDPDGRENPRGSAIAEILVDLSATVLNTGEGTRRDPVSGALSAPDLSIASQGLADRCKWSMCDRLNSDHIPILIEVGLSIQAKVRQGHFV
jgi:hypothetical protein